VEKQINSPKLHQRQQNSQHGFLISITKYVKFLPITDVELVSVRRFVRMDGAQNGTGVDQALIIVQLIKPTTTLPLREIQDAKIV